MTEREFELACNKIIQGDRDGLKEIYSAYLPFVFAVIHSVLKNREDAEDVTTDFFIKLWSLAEKYRTGNGHKGWMATVARNMAIDYYRAHYREIPSEDEFMDVAVSQAGTETSHEEEIVSNQTVQEMLQKLNGGERQIINLKILGDMTFKEIAQVLGIPMGTVTWRYQNAIKKLRRCGYES